MRIRPHALVVDDDDDVRELLASELDAMGFDVVSAGSGQQALAQCSEGRFALVVTDLVMPDGDGLTFIEQLRQIDQEAIVLVITGYPTLETSVEAMQKGAYDYICKPFHTDDLQLRVKRAMEAHRLRTRLSSSNRAVMLLVASIPLWLAIGVLVARTVN